ncbi:SRPBCC family protein [Methylocystis sp. Sn-Cys]|uniref:SRPBCC family protein n=1 Tax=Methylocystis sp. Sn-Cys TaxID=1701263 RepID=UPI001924C459|nr:SRPBCC family protein [Methylocystis sp. Sn-Cys]MBL1256034.1 SRPBCC family protein [Methylocystis sp. Sn-Cys]
MNVFAVGNEAVCAEAASKIRAPLRFEGVGYYDAAPEKMFAAISEPELMSKWLPMLKSLHLSHAASDNGPASCGIGSERSCSFSMMGDVFERVIWWDPPRGYAFSFQPKNRLMMPTRDHSVVFLVRPHGNGGSEFVFRTYFNWQPGPMRFVAAHMMPMILNMSLANLKRLLGGKGGKARRVA